MNKTFFTIGLGWLAMAGLVWPASGADLGRKTLPGHVPAVVSQLSAVSRLAATNELHLAIGLPLRNQEAMKTLLQQVYDPASPNYRSFLSPDEFAAQFGPTAADYQAVIHFARTNGLKVVGGSSNRTLVDVVGKVADIERTFHVSLRAYQHPKEARQFYAPDAEPTVDAALPVLSVYGLNNFKLPKPLNHRSTSKGTSFGHYATGSSPSGSYWGYDFRNAYAPGVTLTGTGQSVALFECDGYYPFDVSSYLAATGLPSVTLTNVLIDGATGQPSGFGGEVEVALDIDMAISMAPGLSQVIVYETPDDIPAFNLDMLNQIALDNLAKQISSSWLIDDTPQFAQIYVQFALQGQSFLQASGDSGAYYPGIFQFEDSPLVTLVGGTTLTSTGPGGVWASEQVWNNGFDPFAGHEWAGGGGVSQVYSIPSWQTNISMTTNMGSTTMRNIPDVSLTADNIYIWGDGAPIADEGGTSCAAPLWAGFMALVNQQLAANGKAPIGFLNPIIYSLARGTNYNSLFHDIVVGNNTNNVQTTLYSAVPGYDLASGWGTPNGTNLINALAGAASLNSNNIAAIIPAPSRPWGTNLAVMNGANPNGLWLLYYQDVIGNGYSGTNYNGWSVNLTTANPVGFPADNQLSVNTFVGSLPYGNATNVPVLPGSLWSMTLAVTNYGPAGSTNVVVSDDLPLVSGVNLVSASSSLPSSTINQVGSTVIWNAGNLANNAGGTLSLTLQITNNASALSVLTNSAIVGAASPDPNHDDDSITVIATVSAPPMISLVFTHAGVGGLHLCVTNDPGATVIIQATTNLVSGWVPFVTNVSPFVFTNFDTTNFQRRFYRAYIPQ